MEEYLADFNAESKQPMHLVMFRDAIDHVSRISRILRYPRLASPKTSKGSQAGTTG